MAALEERQKTITGQLADVHDAKRQLEELIARLTGDIDTTAAGLGLRRKQANNGPVNGSRAQAIARGGSGRP